MNWFSWRQHRNTYAVFIILLIGFAAMVVPSGNHFWHTYQQSLSMCAENPANPTCSDLTDSLFQGSGAIIDTVFVVGLGAPILVGLFLGSPLLAKEYEEGTNKLVWTQSISRRKWLATRVFWSLLFAALYGLAVTLLVTWWSRTLNSFNHDRFDTGQFDIQGLMPIAYAIFFTAVGITMGAWFRKTLVALAVTLSVFALCMATVGQWVRPHYMRPTTIVNPVGPRDAQVPQGAWVLKRAITNKAGQAIYAYTPQDMPASCWALIQQAKISESNQGATSIPSPYSTNAIIACLNKAGFHQVTTYQPKQRYWDFQRIEASIYLSMTAVAVGMTYWLVLKRDA